MENYSVYWIRHKDHTDIFTQGYVGVTNRFIRRIWEHLTLNQNRHLSFAIQKYGWDNLIKEQVLVADKDYCLNIESQLRSKDAIGWNVIKGGGMPPKSKKGMNLGKIPWNKGKPWSDEIKKRLSDSVKKLWENQEYREHMCSVNKGRVSPMKGKKFKPESIEKMRLSKIGKPSAKKGMKMSKEIIQRMKELAIKESWICPHCDKQGKSKGAGNRWHFNNCKEKSE